MENNESRMQRVQLRMSAAALSDLDALARAHDLNRSSMVRFLIAQAANGAGTTTRPIEDH